MTDWSDLGVVETIFEEETEDLQSLSSSSPLSPPLSSTSSPLQSAVDAWTNTTRRKPDVKIHVEGICFYLHKDPLISKSSYLKRKLNGVTEYTLSPPLKITAETFKQIVDFCYSGHTIITPFNVAPLRTAAELLKMDVVVEQEDDDFSNDESLCQITESYFSMVLALNKDLVCNVFHSCLSLLPEAEHTAFLASRCLESLFSLDGSDDDDEEENENGLAGCADGLKTVSLENFRVIADSMQRRLTGSHDLLYRVVDLYFLVYTGKITEEQRSQICSCIDCGILSSSLLLHAVQNPRMPLRFIVQAMLIEQLNTHRSIFSALNSATATTTTTTTAPRPQPRHKPSSPATLGAILERDAALRQVAKLRATIDTTSSRIQTLERELTGMKQLLLETEKHKQNNNKNNSLLVLDQAAGRSSSCRFSSNVNNKVERGERGSVSSSMLRFRDPKSENDQTVISPKNVKRNFGQRLIRGLKTAFGASSKAKDHRNGKAEQMGINNGDENDGVSKILQVVHSDSANPHHRNHSVS